MEDQHKIETSLYFDATPDQLAELANAMSKIGITGKLSLQAPTEAFRIKSLDPVAEKEDAVAEKEAPAPKKRASRSGAKSSAKSTSTTSDEDEDEDEAPAKKKKSPEKPAKKVVDEDPEEEEDEDEDEDDDFDIDDIPKKLSIDHLRKLTGFLSKKGHSDIVEESLEYFETEVLADLEKENYLTFWKRAAKKYKKATAED